LSPGHRDGLAAGQTLTKLYFNSRQQSAAGKKPSRVAAKGRAL
jgi:hypothetical protein